MRFYLCKGLLCDSTHRVALLRDGLCFALLLCCHMFHTQLVYTITRKYHCQQIFQNLLIFRHFLLLSKYAFIHTARFIISFCFSICKIFLSFFLIFYIFGFFIAIALFCNLIFIYNYQSCSIKTNFQTICILLGSFVISHF